MEPQASGNHCPGCRKLEQVVQRQSQEIEALKKKLAEVIREGKRQAAPFRMFSQIKHHKSPHVPDSRRAVKNMDGPMNPPVA